MSKISYFPAAQSEKDQAWRMRVVETTKGALGQSVEKTGFLKFESEAEADTATELLDSDGATLSMGAPIFTVVNKVRVFSGLYEVEAQLVEVEVAAQ